MKTKTTKAWCPVDKKGDFWIRYIHPTKMDVHLDLDESCSFNWQAEDQKIRIVRIKISEVKR